MAAKEERVVYDDPNFTVVCSFLDKYGELLGISKISFNSLQTHVKDTRFGKLVREKFVPEGSCLFGTQRLISLLLYRTVAGVELIWL